MMSEKEMNRFYEDDSRTYELPEYIKKMTPEERDKEMDRLEYEMIHNPEYPRKEKKNTSKIMFYI